MKKYFAKFIVAYSKERELQTLEIEAAGRDEARQSILRKYGCCTYLVIIEA